ncbi:MAG: hypothetical protein JWP97_3058 [Labilithrix sp.]|nr:hypothetical protein [Labilithrix sp.]
MSDDGGDKSFDPTDQKREQFRKEGRFAKSRDAGGVVATIAVLGVLAGSKAGIADGIRTLFAQTLGDLGALHREGPWAVIRLCALHCATLAGPAVAAAMVGSVVIGVAQSGVRPYMEMLTPKPERLDPRGALGKMFSPKRAVSELAVAMLRVGVVGYVAYRAFMLEVPILVSLSRIPLEAALPVLGGVLGRVFALATGSLLIVSLIDYGQSWWSISKELKMTRQERTDESRQQDGDPKAKGRMKQRARSNAKKRSMLSIKSADVIVTNPTHVAVALRYGPKDPAPVVIAKGHDEVALRIRAEARKHGIPILENRRLARALDAEVQVGRPVPPGHFAAVARVLAFVYKLGGKARKRGLAR